MKNATETRSDALVPRHAAEQVQQSLQEAPVVVVNGPRQAGKTTLVRDQVLPLVGGSFVTLDDEVQLQACLADPVTFIDRESPVVIDEFQRAGDSLLRTIKADVDRKRTPGRFLLTGSTRFLTLSRISESLAGRVHIVDLWPFSQGEAKRLGPESDTLLPALFDSPSVIRRLGRRPMPTRREILDRICRGGYPEAQYLDPAARRRFFANYLRTVTLRDVPEISRIRHLDELPRILRLLAAATAQEINDADLAARLNIDRRTLRANYLPLLHTVYLAHEVPAWSRNLVSRVSKRSKSYLADTGIAAHLLGVDAERIAQPTAVATGPLMETFTVNELVRQVARFGAELGVSLFHYRAHTGSEIDLVIEGDDGRTVGIEIKAAASVRAEDFRHLVGLRDRLDGLRDARFVRGVLFYAGSQALGFGDRLEALPVASLWLPPV
ncbi:MAG: ATP-binding protein [Planctomycetota bacterium]